MADFDRAITFVLAQEGGYVNDPNDPGGETNFGISKRAYPDVDIAGLTAEAAKGIYKRDYWDVLLLDSRSYADAVAILDTAVNMGVSRVREFMGVIPAGNNFVTKLLAERIYTYSTFKAWPNYGHGWIARVLRCAIEGQRGP